MCGKLLSWLKSLPHLSPHGFAEGSEEHNALSPGVGRGIGTLLTTRAMIGDYYIGDKVVRVEGIVTMVSAISQVGSVLVDIFLDHKIVSSLIPDR
jgi:hypothetical protein